ncbi:MAG: succinate--CoA ligase subunit alpha [Candidatus Hydrothermarchaeota archaeon]
MSILADKSTKVLVQGITGREGSFHTERMIAYGTNVVAGVTPGKGGGEIHGVPVYNSVEEAVIETGANASLIFVPAKFATDAIFESIYAGLDLIVCVSEGIPVHDMLRISKYLKETDTVLVGPNCPGIIVPEKTLLGIMPWDAFKKGSVGVVSRSGTLTYQIVDDLTRRGIGQSTCIGIGGDPIVGTTFIDVLKLFEEDPETKAIVLIGEIGGTKEEEAAEYIKEYVNKPVVGFIAGRYAPPEKRMGHAGAIISRGTGTPDVKIKTLERVGVKVGTTPSGVAEIVEELL